MTKIYKAVAKVLAIVLHTVAKVTGAAADYLAAYAAR